MSYGLKYKLPYKTLKGNNLEVRISQRDYLQEDDYYTGYGVSHISLKYEDVDLYESVKPSNASISLLAKESAQYREFKNAKDRDYKIEIYQTDTPVISKEGTFNLVSKSTNPRIQPYISLQDSLDSYWYYSIRANFDLNSLNIYERTGIDRHWSGDSFTISSDGYTIFVAVYDRSNSSQYDTVILQFNLSSPWDLNTAPSTPNKEFTIPDKARPMDLSITDDGLKMFVGFYDSGLTSGYDGIAELTLSTANEIDTATVADFVSRSGGVMDIFVEPSRTEHKLFVLEDSGVLYSYDIGVNDSLSAMGNEYSKNIRNLLSTNTSKTVDGFHISKNKFFMTSQYLENDEKYYIHEFNLEYDWSLQGTFDYIYRLDADDTPKKFNRYCCDFDNNGEYIFLAARGYIYWGTSAHKWEVNHDTSWTLKIDENEDGSTTDIISISYTTTDPGYNYSSNEGVINDIIQKLENEYPNKYAGEDSTGDNYLDKIIRIDGVSTLYSGSVEILISEESFPDYLMDCGNFGGGVQGDVLKIQSIEEESVTNTITLASVEQLPGMSREDVIEVLVNGINSANPDYIGQTNEDDQYQIDIFYEGNLVAADVTLSLYSEGDWDANISGITENEISGDQLLWVGYNIGGLYQEDYQGYMYEVSIKATDGLADLKAFDFPFSSGGISYMKMIAEVLKYTDLQLPINSAFDIFEDNMNQTNSDDPLSQLYIEREALGEKPCKEILNEKLKGFQLIQDRGEWWIVRIEYTGSYNYRKFDWTGVYVNNNSFDPIIKFSGESDYRQNRYAVNINQSGLLEVNPGARYYLTKQNYGLKDQMLRDPTFAIMKLNQHLKHWDASWSEDAIDNIPYEHNVDEILRFIGTLNYTTNAIDYSQETTWIQQINDIQSEDLIMKSELEVLPIERSQMPDLTYDWELVTDQPLDIIQYGVAGLYLLDISNVTNTNEFEVGMALKMMQYNDPEDKYVLVHIYAIDEEDGYLYVWTYDHDYSYIDSDDLWDAQFYLYASICYMDVMVQLDNESWYDGEKFVGAEQEVQRFQIFQEYVNVDHSIEKSKSFDMSVPERREAKVRIWQPTYNDVLIKKLKIDYKGKGLAKGSRTKRYYEQNIYKEEPDKITLYQGDLPVDYHSKSPLFMNGLYLDEDLTNPTENWNSGSKYFDIVVNRMVEQLSQNGFILTGDFIIPDIIPARAVIHDLLLDRYFQRKGFTYDLSMDTIKGEWIEIGFSPSQSLQVETKLFEDDPRGADIYNDNRESFETAGEGGTTIIQDVNVEKEDITQFSFKAEDLGLIDVGSFKGNDVGEARKINLNHNRNRSIVVLILVKDGKRLSPANYSERYINSSNVEVTIGVPFEDSTTFNYIIY